MRYNVLMDNFVIEILPLCLSAMGGAILIMSIFTLLGKVGVEYFLFYVIM